MNTNVNNIEPNLAICLKDHELKHYNLVWNKDHYVPGRDTNRITDALLVKTSTGDLIPPSYPSSIELQTQVDSLDYDGEYFWSVQAINDTPNFPGWIVSKWQINADEYSAQRLQFKSFPGFDKAGAVAIESYRFAMQGGTDPTRNWITVDTTYDWILSRIGPGHQIKVGPNNRDEVFWGTITEIKQYPHNPIYPPQYWEIYFKEYLNSSYVAGEDLFVEANLFVCAGSSLYQMHPVDLSVRNKYDSNLYSNITGCAFSVMKNVSSINVGMRTPALFFARDMAIFSMPVNSLGHMLSAQVLENNFNRNGNSFIQVHELRIRNDDYESLTNHPQHYLLQKEYREDRNIDGTVQSWSNYNYVLKNVAPQPALMVVNAQPQDVTQSGIVYCSCQILDNYSFPVPDVQVTWSHACGTKAYFLDPTVSGTDANGYVYNRLFLTDNLSFPAYVTATTDQL